MQPSSPASATPAVPAVPGVPAAPTAPAAPATGAAGATTAGGTTAGTAVPGLPPTDAPRTREQLEMLRRHRSEISSQLNSAQDRRDELAKQLRNPMVDGADRRGIEQRLGVLDGRIVNLERDLDATGQLIAAAPTTLISVPPRDANFGRHRFRSGFGAGAMVMLVLALVLSRVLRPQRWRGGSTLARPTGAAAADSARLARVEQAVEAIAIEVERVSEGQRFVTQLLAERTAAPIAVPIAAGRPHEPALRDDLLRDADARDATLDTPAAARAQ